MLKAGAFLQNRYEIIYRIGSGGMADVYRAKDHKLNRFVAVKVLKQEFREDTAFLSKFRVEAQAAAGMAHPNIVNVYDVGEDRGVNFIVMELVEGITLKAYISKKGKLSVREAASIALQVAAGLEAAHNNGIVHRDVKPQNILISTDGKAKVADFGIARAANSNTITSNAMGSVHYSAPEQTRGSYSDAKSDIYSMGITMFEMLTGRVPFDGDTTVEVALRHLQDEIPSPRKFTPEIPYAMEQIVLKCTQKNPNRRYSNMSDLIRDLKEALVNPNGNFVVIPAVDHQADTIMLSKEELEQIKTSSMPSYDTDLDTGAASRIGEDGNVGGDGRDYGYSGDYYQSSSYQKVRGQNSARTSLEAGFTEEYPGRLSARKRDLYEEELDVQEAVRTTSHDERRSRRNRRPQNAGGDHFMRILFILGAIAIAGVIFLIGARTMGLVGRNNTTQTESAEQTQTLVPDLKGHSEDEAKQLLSDTGLGYSYQGESPSQEYAKGMVIEQSVEAGTQVEKNTTIGYVLSSGNQTPLTVPTLSNATLEEAEKALGSMGLRVSVDTTRYSETIAEGQVITTNPGAGSEVTAGDLITIYVSQGPDAVTVPVLDVTGKYQSDAQSALSNIGLFVFIKSEPSNEVPEGLVISQDVAADTVVPVGTNITLTVSTGPENTVPATMDEDTDKQWMCNAQLSAPENYNGEPVRIVLEQNGTQTTIFEGETSFPYILNITGQSGVSTGTVFVYTLNASTWEVIQTTEYDNVAFSPV